MAEETKLEKIVEKIIETLIVGLVVGFFFFVYNQSNKVDEVDAKVDAQSLVDKKLTEELSQAKAEIARLNNQLRLKDPFQEMLPEKSAETIKEEIQQGIDKEIYRSKELKR